MLLTKKFFGLVKKTLGLVHTSNNLPEWQAIKLTFFAPWDECYFETSSFHILKFHKILFPYNSFQNEFIPVFKLNELLIVVQNFNLVS